MDRGEAGGVLDLLAGRAFVAVGDVVGDGPGEQKRGLPDVTDRAADGLARHLVQASAADGDIPFARVGQPQQHFEPGRFAAPRAARDTDGFAVKDFQRDPVEGADRGPARGDVLDHQIIDLDHRHLAPAPLLGGLVEAAEFVVPGVGRADVFDAVELLDDRPVDLLGVSHHRDADALLGDRLAHREERGRGDHTDHHRARQRVFGGRGEQRDDAGEQGGEEVEEAESDEADEPVQSPEDAPVGRADAVLREAAQILTHGARRVRRWCRGSVACTSIRRGSGGRR